MNRRVLYVQGAQPGDDSLEVLGEEFDVRLARGSANALELGRKQGPFAVVVSEEDVADMSGRELLRMFQDEWPDTRRVLVSGQASLGSALAAIRECDMHRFVLPSPDPTELLDAVRSGVERAHFHDFDQLTIEQLRFAREYLLDASFELEARLDARMDCLRALSELASQISAAESLPQVARFSARAVSSALAGCGAKVIAFDGSESSHHVEAEVGPSVGKNVHEVALICGDQDLGKLQVDLDTYPPGRIGSAERQFLDSVAATAAAAAAHQIRRRERDEAQHATILALARLAEHRDDETGRHLERVSLYCRLVALALREDGKHTDVIDAAFVDNIERSAPLHDIGKVGISDSILLKPGKLDPEEWVVMKTHTEIGAQTLRPLVERSSSQSHLRMGLDIAWCHHEKWDGSGYPRGLAGEDIPLAARILALADCYDALTTRRPYKEPWSHEDAMKYVTEQSGRHFDPDVVRAFVARVDKIDQIRGQLADDDAARE